MNENERDLDAFTRMIGAILQSVGLPAEPLVFVAPDGTQLHAIADANSGEPVLFVAGEGLRVLLNRAMADSIIADVPDYVPEEWASGE
jgi:hypothetical protein